MPSTKCKAETLKMRFWKKVDQNGPVPAHWPELGPCWIWTASKNKQGYGMLGTSLGVRHTHIVSWFLHTGKWPKEKTLHICDNTSCIRFSHLEQGTQHKNVHDAIKRGIFARSKLTENQAAEIKRLYDGRRGAVSALAKQFKVHRHTIQHIIHRHTWRHLEAHLH